MPNYRGNEKQDLMIPVCLDDQLVPGTMEHAINRIVDHEIDTSVFDAACHNDHGGRSACDPAAMVKIILFAYSPGYPLLTEDRGSLPDQHRVHGPQW